MREKKTYIEPEAVVTEFECEDIITTSGAGNAAMEKWADENDASVFTVLYNELN